jgi:2-polyprenyl-6-methoxyphenol hydroxylase-like FAD-dependent oxidoreductase
MAGLMRLEKWFPGFTDELLAQGAMPVDPGSESFRYEAGGSRFRHPLGMKRAVASRALLEHTIRRWVAQQPNITFTHAAVRGLHLASNRTAVTGVVLDDGVFPAELVVDATGRAGQGSRWLQQLGFDPPPVSSVTIDMGYVTRTFHRRPDDDRGWLIGAVIGDPPARRMGFVMAMEGNRWMVTLAGFHGDHPPIDGRGWRAFARSLPSDAVADLVDAAEPLGEPVTHRLPTNQRRHVERMRTLPGGFVFLGDSIASFNPIYGQGMTSAAMQAEVLGTTVDAADRFDARFVKTYNRRVASIVAAPWLLSVADDFLLPGTSGPKPRGTRALLRYLPTVKKAIQVDPVALQRLIEVTHLVAPPATLFRPSTFLRMVRSSRRAGLSRTRDARVPDEAQESDRMIA